MTAPARLAPPVVRVGVVESTQTVAWRLAADGAADRTVVVADHQTAGRGRRGRAWEDEPGASLLVSLLVRPRLAAALRPALSLAAGVAVVEALEAVAGLAARLKWPNDVLVGGRKLAGILVESRGGEPATLVVGVGVNLAQRSFPDALAARATSVWLETGRAPDREAVLAALLDAFDAWRARLEREGMAPLAARWGELADTLGRRVTADGVAGVAVGLDADGALLVDDGAGLRRVVSGEIAIESGVDHAPGR